MIRSSGEYSIIELTGHILEGRTGVEPAYIQLQVNVVIRSHFCYRPIFKNILALRRGFEPLVSTLKGWWLNHSPNAVYLILAVSVGNDPTYSCLTDRRLSFRPRHIIFNFGSREWN